MIVSEQEFREALKNKLKGITAKCVTGPGRSGAIAAVYASYYLKIPFIPFNTLCPLKPILVVDTAEMSGATLRKASRRYGLKDSLSIAIFQETSRIKFWYENL